MTLLGVQRVDRGTIAEKLNEHVGKIIDLDYIKEGRRVYETGLLLKMVDKGLRYLSVSRAGGNPFSVEFIGLHEAVRVISIGDVKLYNNMAKIQDNYRLEGPDALYLLRSSCWGIEVADAMEDEEREEALKKVQQSAPLRRTA